MLVVLVITTIVIGLAFAALQLIQSQYGSIKRSLETSLETQKLEQQLWIDFHRYTDIRLDTKDEQLNLTNGNDQVVYSIGSDYMIRKKDTLLSGKSSGTYYFKGKEVTSGPVDALKLSIGTKRKVELFVFKQNDAKQHVHYELSD